MDLEVGANESEPESDEAIRLRMAKARVGRTLRNKWHLDALLGLGGMGAVYEATHRNGLRGAVKMLDCGTMAVGALKARFLREGRIANEVGHAGAVRVLDDDETEDGNAYLVMELLAGRTLEQLAEDAGGKLPASDVVRYALQVLDTLGVAHERGVVHRDIKPENLFLTTEGTVKILDFGIARMNRSNASTTQTGEPMGTPAFMAPEQARGRWSLVDAQSDLFALGASMYTLLTGSLVHSEAGTVVEMIVAAMTRTAPSLAIAMPDVCPELVIAIDKALQFEKSDRWLRAIDMRKQLEKAYLVLTGEEAPLAIPARAVSLPDVSSYPPRAPEFGAQPTQLSARTLTSYRVRAAIAGALALAVSGGMVAYGYRSHSMHHESATSTAAAVPDRKSGAPKMSERFEATTRQQPVHVASEDIYDRRY